MNETTTPVYVWKDEIPNHPCWFFAKGPKHLGVIGGRKIVVGRVVKATDYFGNEFLRVEPNDIPFDHKTHPGAIKYAEIPSPFTETEILTGGAES